MTEKITYYAIVGEGRTINNPFGLARRIEGEDECLLRDFSWDHTPVIVEWERGDFADELVEVDTVQAETIMGYFRRRWSQDPAVPDGSA